MGQPAIASNPSGAATARRRFSKKSAILVVLAAGIVGACTTPPLGSQTALLLPDGRVFTGGGDTRTNDYQIFWPPYLDFSPVRPVLTTILPTPLAYDTPYSLDYQELPFGDFVAKAVLMSPGSVTHHRDPNMRYVEIQLEPGDDGKIAVRTPKNETYAPRGWYMLFLVSSTGVPSIATWVRLP